MAQEKAQNLQDTFLNTVRRNKVSVTVFLVNGVKLQGVITWFDNFCVLLRRDGMSQLVYKHAISTIMPAQQISLYDEDGDANCSVRAGWADCASGQAALRTARPCHACRAVVDHE